MRPLHLHPGRRNSRLVRDPNGMTLRRSSIEHPFGGIKVWIRGTRFLKRRLKFGRSGMALNVLADTIKRMVGLLGIRG